MANSQLRNDNSRSHKGGANFVCMHNEPEFPEGFDPSHNDGSNYMYGIEFGCHGGLNPPTADHAGVQHPPTADRAGVQQEGTR